MDHSPGSPIDPAHLPRHIGIIMDGNGRWASRAGLTRHKGHREGLEAAKRTVKAAKDLGIEFLSLYTFSTENWKRTEDEVSFLMGLIASHLRKEYDFYRENEVRVLHSGDLSRLPANLQNEIIQVTKDTRHFDGIQVNLAINYGGRDEIVRSVNRWLHNGRGSSDLTIDTLREHLDLPHMPEPDLLIRTGGERRLSNFLLWECAYSELVFSDVLWPDFGANELHAAVQDFQHRTRKFGGMECAT
ncbi:MAG: di-trans,poly-cis-decaprenylcistransferase [Spirochaetales bacterium]|nr:MAG: di-trans,poly-cis-decaprenylcistransferase [Spirochaetales bacterium]